MRAWGTKPCKECGAPCDGHTRISRCKPCWDALIALRWSLAAGMYIDGWLLREIGAVFGISAHGAAVMLSRMRRAGWELPVRQSKTRWST